MNFRTNSRSQSRLAKFLVHIQSRRSCFWTQMKSPCLQWDRRENIFMFLESPLPWPHWKTLITQLSQVMLQWKIVSCQAISTLVFGECLWPLIVYADPAMTLIKSYPLMACPIMEIGPFSCPISTSPVMETRLPSKLFTMYSTSYLRSFTMKLKIRTQSCSANRVLAICLRPTPCFLRCFCIDFLHNDPSLLILLGAVVCETTRSDWWQWWWWCVGVAIFGSKFECERLRFWFA